LRASRARFLEEATVRELQTLVQEGRGGLAQDPTKFGDLVQKSLREKFGNMREWPSSPANRSDAFRVIGERMQRNIEEQAQENRKRLII
jgi:hypothetical protein